MLQPHINTVRHAVHLPGFVAHIYLHSYRQQLRRHTRDRKPDPVFDGKNHQPIVISDWREGRIGLLPENGYAQPCGKFICPVDHILRGQADLADIQYLIFAEFAFDGIVQIVTCDEFKHIPRLILEINGM